MKNKSNDYKIFFLRDRNKFPVACVASRLVATPACFFVAFSVATHNPSDTFSRARGREVAIGRLEQDICSVVVAGPGAKARIIERISLNKYAPIRTREAASYWLWRKAHENSSEPQRIVSTPPIPLEHRLPMTRGTAFLILPGVPGTL